MNEVTIPIKLVGLGEMKAELKQIKNELVTATDPAEIERLSSRAGELNQKLKDTNKTIKNFSTGSTIQQVGNQVSGIKDSLMNLDFSKAATQVTAFTGTVSKFKVSDLTKGLGLLTSAVGKLGAQFLKMGLQLLTNPIFLLVVVIVAIVLAFTVWEDKLGKFGTALKIAFFGIYILVEAVKLLIEGFKKLTDWLGLTSFAADDNAERVKAAAEKSTEASKKRTEQISQYYDQEIAMARAAGKDTVVLEIRKSKELEAEAEVRKAAAQATLDSMAHMVGTAAEEEKQKLRDKLTEENEIIRGADNAREVMYAANEKKVADNAKKVADNARAVWKTLNDKRIADQKTFDTNRLNAERQIEDLRIAAIKDDAVREGELLKEKYERLRADLLKDATKNDIEKAALLKAFNLAETQEKDKMTEAAKKKENEAYQALNALKIANMVEGEAKIAEQQKVAYNQSINAAKEKYGADSALFIEIQDELAKADAATTKARGDKKIADQQALLNSLNELGLTDDQRKILAIEAQYLKEQELANGNAETLLALENKHKADIEKVENDAAIARIEKEKQVRDSKLAFAKDTVDGLTNLGGMLIKDQKKLEKFNKASALIQIGIDTAKAISSLVAAANMNPFNAVTGGGAGIAQFAAGIIQIATNVAKAKQILSSPGTAPSAGGGGGGGGGGDTGGTSAATVLPQAAQLFGSSNNASTMNAGGDNSNEGNMTVTAVVSETQITNVQNKINLINKNAEL